MDISVPDKASSSSPFSKGWLYDVFISFRGEDTRKNFTGHLYEALTRAGINAFIDDEELRKGEDLKTKFERAIQGSKISIIVFSRQYANSSWCLEELVKIMECRRTQGQLVLPIFYDVDPSHVRKQSDSFGQLFLKHIDERKVERWKEERWRTALTEASNLSGWDLRNTFDGHEAKFIRMITKEVTGKLNNTYLDVAPYQVGLDSRVQDISNYLRIGDSDDVRMIGILGMGGIGKTTIAKAIYNKFCERFEGKCFLEKVRAKKLKKLQEKLLSDILQTTKTNVSSVDAGTTLVGERFQRLKVLVIFDDVDDVKQLHGLARNRHSFGPGSRIIITTRDKRVLEEFEVDTTYSAEGMEPEEALELLSWHAFRSSCCPSQYLECAREVVNHCGGLPLALKVLGSTLFKRSVDEWRSILDELKMIPRREIQAQLKISYDGLNDNYKRRIFLDIACFFIGKDKNDVMQILDGCGFCATTGIKVLVDRCLVTINYKNKIMMHDLLRDMGRNIVHAKNPEFPGGRSRLWHPEDVNDVLIEKSGTEKIEGLALDLPSVKEISFSTEAFTNMISFSTEAFTNMKRLRLLQLNYVRLAGGYQCLFKKLSWLCWHGFPLEFIPTELCLPNIVAIDMRYSSLKQVLCECSVLLGKLKILNLSHSHDLTQSPDFSKLPNLEKLILKDCKRLAKVHESIGDLKSLVLVNLKDCEMLEALPMSFYELKSVKTLVLNGCSRFQRLSEHLGEMASLVTLYADGTAITKVPPSIVRLEKLELLSLNYLECPLQLPSLRGLRSLTELCLEDSNLMEVPNDIGSSLPCLEVLCLDNNHFRSLPCLRGLSMLCCLSLRECFDLVEITGVPKSVQSSNFHLDLEGCISLERMAVRLDLHTISQFPGLEDALNLDLDLVMVKHHDEDDDKYFVLGDIMVKDYEDDGYFVYEDSMVKDDDDDGYFVLEDGTKAGWTPAVCMFIVGRQIPTWFNHVNKGTKVSLQADCNAKALAVCLACRPDDSDSPCFISVVNHTKGTIFLVEIRKFDAMEEYLWLTNLSLSKTEFNLEEGDSVDVIAVCSHTVVKKIGVRLACDHEHLRPSFLIPWLPYLSIPYERAVEDISTYKPALEEISTKVDDFDEDDDNDNEPVAHSLESDKPETGSIESIGGGGGEDEEEEPVDEPDDPMEDDAVNTAAIFCIRLKQPRSNLQHKRSVPKLCRNFSAVAWCGKLNAIACASEMCTSIPSSNVNVPFWIPIHIVIPERPSERAVFNVNAVSPRDSVQFIEWSPTSCPRALLIANFHGGVTIWTQPSQGPANLVHDASRWQREHEWWQAIAVVTKWLSGVSPYKLLSSKSSTSSNGKSTFEEKSLSQQSQNSARWPSFLCVCSVFSSGSVQLHWSQYPRNQTSAAPKWFQTSQGDLGRGFCGIMAADAVITDSGAMHVACVRIVNPSTVVVWEVTPELGNGFHTTPKISTTHGVPPSINPPNLAGFFPLAAYLFSWQDYLSSEAKQGRKQTDPDFSDAMPLHCSLVSNFSAFESPKAQSATSTRWGSEVAAVAFDPTRAGSVIAVVITEGRSMSPYYPDEGPRGCRVQRWESSLQPVVLHQIFGNPTSSFGGQAPMQTVWLSKVDTSIQPTNDFKSHQAAATTATTDARKTPDSGIEKVKRVSFDPFDLPSDVRTLARIVYSAHGGEIAVAFLRGGVHIFSGPNFAPVDNYQINVGSAIATPAFSSTSCCSASVWHDSGKDRTVLKIIRVLPPAVPSSQVKANSSTWERAIAERFWWSLLVGVDWWDAVGCTQSAAEDGIVSLNSVIAVLDADFHSLPSTKHRQQYGPNLDRIKCRLLEGTNAQEVRAMVLDMQARLLLDMLGKGIESALINPSALVPEPWQASGETLSGIDPEAMAVEPALVPHIQAYVDAVLDLASHFITRLRRYASFCRTLASHAGAGSNRNMVASPTQSSASPATSQGGQSGTPTSTGNTQMQAWVQGAIAKISSTSDGVSNSAPNPISGPSSFMPISINTGTFPGTPAVRLIGDCHFLHRLCQLLLFCFFFRRAQLPRFSGGAQRNTDANMQKPQPGASGKAEEVSSVSAKSSTTMVRPEEGQVARPGHIPGAKGVEEGPAGRSRLGAGNAGQGYTFEEVKVLFLILKDLCRRTASLAHSLPVSQVGSSNIQVRLHYIDGNYTVLPEVVEASLGPHMQNMPRPRGADAAGLLLRELELHPPAEEWHRRNMYGGPWSDSDDMDPQDDTPKLCNSSDPPDSGSLESCDVYYGAHGLWPRKRRMSERDVAFGLNTSVGLGAYLGIMGSRRDVVTAVWKTGLEGVWYKCIRCLRQTSAFASSGATTPPNQTGRETWWISRWAYCCPMCGGTWVRVV